MRTNLKVEYGTEAVLGTTQMAIRKWANTFDPRPKKISTLTYGKVYSYSEGGKSVRDKNSIIYIHLR